MDLEERRKRGRHARSGIPQQKAVKICHQFANGTCTYGDRCRFSHTLGGNLQAESVSSIFSNLVSPSSSSSSTFAPATASAPSSELCRKFLQGKCSRGDSCPYLHAAPPSASQAFCPPASATTANTNMTSILSSSSLPAAAAATSTMSMGVNPNKKSSVSSYMTQSLFADLPISVQSKKAIADVMRYSNLSVVQEASLPTILNGVDVLVKAKTGTGKTLGFLIPSVELLIKKRSPSRDAVQCLILSPTRELAQQIATEAESLLTFHNGMKVVTVVGGTNINQDKKRLNGKVDILVATPGRLKDHLQNTDRFSERCRENISFLIFDEADQLLDMGFKPDIDAILKHVPPKDHRQTLLFSATVPPSVQEIAKNALRKGFEFIDTVGEDSEQTHLHVHQELVVTNMEDQTSAILSILRREMQVPNYKIIVFFTTARLTGYMATLFQKMQMNVLEIHSRKSQAQRTKTADIFRDNSNVILFSSDVSARGMDYPDVTFVLQVGLTEREQYIHRLGRTARAGKSGKGMLLLAPFEVNTMKKSLSDIPLHNVATESLGPIAEHRSSIEAFLPKAMADGEFRKIAEQAYSAWLGFYNSNLRKCGWDKPKLVQEANLYSQYLGCTEVPTLEKKTVGKMGLKGVVGLRVR